MAEITPVIKGVSCFLAHVPGLVRYGSKPSREIKHDPSLLPLISSHLRGFEAAVAYAPNQVFIGNLDPDDLRRIPSPWYQSPVATASRWGDFGGIMPEEEFYAVLKICDGFDLVMLEEDFLQAAASRLANHPCFSDRDISNLGKGFSRAQIERELDTGRAMPLYTGGDSLVGCLRAAHDEDASLFPEVLIENLSARASGVLALRHLIRQMGEASGIDYLLGFGEEAVGDRYNRGGGSLSKAIGELCGCSQATGSDIKAFCCAPVHALVLAAGLVKANIFKQVALVAGGSLAKLGMKFQGHLRHDIPILEDVLAAIAVRMMV